MTFIYPTASTVAVFVNGLHIDQAYQIQYKESANKIPIYGYNDHKFTKVVKGRQAVSGALVLNFVFPGYLNMVLDKQRQVKNKTPAALYNAGVADSVVSKESLEEDIAVLLRTELPPNTDATSRTARAEYISELISKEKTREATKKKLFKLFSSQDLDPGTPSDLELGDGLAAPSRAVKGVTKMLSPIEQENDGIDIDIYYQDPQLSDWYLSFKNVHFYDVSQAISQAGAEGSSDPLYEVYSFMAREKIIKLLDLT